MNIYFLVEGEAELGVYPSWIDVLLESKLKRCASYNTVIDNQYFIFNSRGFGKMIHSGIRNATAEITANPVFDWFVIIADADHQAVDDRLFLIETVFSGVVLPANCQRKIIIQNRCFETWLCGNQEAYAVAQTSTDRNVQRFISHYNAAQNDPELMSKDEAKFAHLSLAQYHAIYLHHILLPSRYNKGTAHKLIDAIYLTKLQDRVTQTPAHLATLNTLFSFFQTLNERMQVQNNQVLPPQ